MKETFLITGANRGIGLELTKLCLSKNFNVEAVPTLFFIDSDGTILNKIVGYSDGTENEILDVLTNYLNDQDIPYEKFEYNIINKKSNNIEIEADF